MRSLLVLLALLASSACAQPEVGTPKPSAAGDDHAGERRADTVIVRADSLVAPAVEPAVELAVRVATDTLRLALGDTPVTVLVHTAPAPGGRAALAGAGLRLDALSVHDDENTAVEAALDVIARRGGRVVELRHTGARLLAFRAAGAGYTVDPNRIFTDAGRRRTLAALSRDTPAARAAVAAFADALLALYTRTAPDPVVTLHNNTEGNYSAASYRADLARDASAVTLAPPTSRFAGDPDDFFFVTGTTLYDALVPAGVAVVMQNDATATDDGSLSVWAARAGAAYVNVEAQHGHLAEQTRMLEALADVLAAP